uniref:Uncharacterized protein n=1 Tax=Cacopsylla melanoneura TaxID=428564 RepID=A0A8D8QTM4_9HEMI
MALPMRHQSSQFKFCNLSARKVQSRCQADSSSKKLLEYFLHDSQEKRSTFHPVGVTQGFGPKFVTKQIRITRAYIMIPESTLKIFGTGNTLKVLKPSEQSKIKRTPFLLPVK